MPLRELGGNGSLCNDSYSRRAGDSGDGFFESSLRPDRDDLVDRCQDDRQNGRRLDAWAILL